MKLRERYEQRLNLKPNDIRHRRIVARNMAVEIVAVVIAVAFLVFSIAAVVAVFKVAFFM